MLSEDRAKYYVEQAERCLRLAHDAPEPRAAAKLRALAQEYRALADGLVTRAGNAGSVLADAIEA